MVGKRRVGSHPVETTLSVEGEVEGVMVRGQQKSSLWHPA